MYSGALPPRDNNSDKVGGMHVCKREVRVPAVAGLLGVGVVARLEIVNDEMQLLLAGRGDLHFVAFLLQPLVGIHHFERFGSIAG